MAQFDMLENSKVIEFDMDALLGDEVFDFYGVCNESFKLSDFVIIPLEDPDDGYRSYIDQFVVSLRPDTFIYPALPIARVKVKVVNIDYGFAGYQLVDVDDYHVWLEVGTNHTDDYYPYTVFDYIPKGKKDSIGVRMLEASDFKQE